MTPAIEIREMPSQRLLVKKTTCAHKEIGLAFGTAIHAVAECFRRNGAGMMSAPMAVYLNWRDSDCDMAVGCQAEGNVQLSEGCEWLDVPGGTHARVTHLGPYETLHESHAAIRNWCAAKGIKMAGPCWESYPKGPISEPDSSKWQTDVNYPVEVP
jgi:effector-binding domain-containing protein